MKKIKNIGNLKFIKQEIQDKKIKSEKNINYLNKRIVITAVSTHKSEEELIGRLHKNLKKKNSRFVNYHNSKTHRESWRNYR